MTPRNPKLWGPHAWVVLETLASRYDLSTDTGDPTSFPALLKLLVVLLPCSLCRESLAEYLNTAPTDLAQLRPGHARKFVYDLHTRVNRKLDKPTPLACEEALGLRMSSGVLSPKFWVSYRLFLTYVIRVHPWSPLLVRALVLFLRASAATGARNHTHFARLTELVTHKTPHTKEGLLGLLWQTHTIQT